MLTNAEWEGSVWSRFPPPVNTAPLHTRAAVLPTPPWQLHSNLGDFSNGVFHVVKIITGLADDKPDMGLFNTEKTFGFSPNVPAGANKIPE